MSVCLLFLFFDDDGDDGECGGEFAAGSHFRRRRGQRKGVCPGLLHSLHTKVFLKSGYFLKHDASTCVTLLQWPQGSFVSVEIARILRFSDFAAIPEESSVKSEEIRLILLLLFELFKLIGLNKEKYASCLDL